MDAQLKAILEEFWSWRLKNAPEFATAVGYHEKDDKLDDHRLEAYANRLVSVFSRFKAQLTRIEIVRDCFSLARSCPFVVVQEFLEFTLHLFTPFILELK